MTLGASQRWRCIVLQDAISIVCLRNATISPSEIWRPSVDGYVPNAVRDESRNRLKLEVKNRAREGHIDYDPLEI
jgi:hypothetical protein